MARLHVTVSNTKPFPQRIELLLTTQEKESLEKFAEGFSSEGASFLLGYLPGPYPCPILVPCPEDWGGRQIHSRNVGMDSDHPWRIGFDNSSATTVLFPRNEGNEKARAGYELNFFALPNMDGAPANNFKGEGRGRRFVVLADPKEM